MPILSVLCLLCLFSSTVGLKTILLSLGVGFDGLNLHQGCELESLIVFAELKLYRLKMKNLDLQIICQLKLELN